MQQLGPSDMGGQDIGGLRRAFQSGYFGSCEVAKSLAFNIQDQNTSTHSYADVLCPLTAFCKESSTMTRSSKMLPLEGNSSQLLLSTLSSKNSRRRAGSQVQQSPALQRGPSMMRLTGLHQHLIIVGGTFKGAPAWEICWIH